MWAMRGLRNGRLTTRWPAGPDDYAAGTRGPATLIPLDTLPLVATPAAPALTEITGVTGLCPADAISAGDPAGIRLDQGRCICCGRCVAARPDLFGWSAGPGAARLSRDGLVVPAPE